MSTSTVNSDLFVPRKGEPYSDKRAIHSSHVHVATPFLSDENAQTNAFGYPVPGPQTLTPAAAIRAHFFVDTTTWDAVLDHGEFDDVIVGSGFCALAYVSEALERDPFRKILILERGGFWLADHYQNLPLPYRAVLDKQTQVFPWQLSSKTYRSELKSGWCPQPSKELMRGFPESLLKAQAEPIFWKKAKLLLHVTPADKIQNNIFATLQTKIGTILKDNLSQIPSATSVEPAPLAVGKSTPTSTRLFNKFSIQGPLLTLQDKQRQLAISKRGSPLMIATDVVVESFLTDPDNNNKVNVLNTSRGNLCFPDENTNIILATSAIPATTILLNSLESMQERAGNRLSGQILTYIPARFPIDQERFPGLGGCSQGDTCTGDCGHRLQMSATYIAGQDSVSQQQYHIQITAIYSPHPKWDIVDAGRESTDYAVSVTLEQLEGSDNCIVLICTSLGEFNERNPDSWMKHNPKDSNPITNVKVQATMDQKTTSLQEVMDKATFDAITVLAGSKFEEIEYWHNEGKNCGWSKEKLTDSEIHVPGLIHDASTLYMGPESDPHAGVDENYTPYGCKNVYVTGAAIFPSAGSWNPTLTMCGFAQDLARKIVPIAPKA
ncbi:hypothetical protein CVT25_006660 [Psilocybe cyanescens]|uniref:Glucose-methanol-choline oxidoreductase C-terminal domain-containing protein n=1 Tax=Psilocybe cyanescens TaxID=93625 RepID=A0A409XU77_PSICY|nr:hypothetical protein CVT25_006660 [Psilocybe cyanescens]